MATSISNTDPSQLFMMEGIIKLVVKGLNHDQIARQINISRVDLKNILINPAFEPYFKQIDSNGYMEWKEAKTAIAKREQVKTAAAADAGEYYARAKEIVLSSNELKDKERLDALLKLLSMSDVMGDHVTEEIINLSPADRKVIQAALSEQDLPRDLN